MLTANEIAELRKQLYSPVLADVLDQLGYRNQAMQPFVRPLDEAHVIFGPARTGRYMPVAFDPNDVHPYDIEIALIDDLRPGDVAVFGCNGPTDSIGPWGELLTTAAQQRGAAGCITDGLVRDVRQIRELGFPVFCGGVSPLDSRGRGKMMTRDTPIECAGVRIDPGDFVFADIDGVVVIPGAVLTAAIDRALKKVSGENSVREALRAGESLKSVFDRLGIL
jgi:4-hydroxy-4-methyl-2-oxoglutarate aldolase